MTEKCFLNFTSAISSFKCIGLVGPNLSGKRETIALLAQVKIFKLNLYMIKKCSIKILSKPGVWTTLKRNKLQSKYDIRLGKYLHKRNG